MSPLAISQLLLALAQLIPAATQVAMEIRSTASAGDQAAVDQALAAFAAAAAAHLATAETDLDAAAKTS